MDKIPYFKVKDITVSGFKCFQEEQRFEFGDMTFITGDNHVGKTSLADAIAFAFTGRFYNGSTSMDHLYSDGSRNMKVEVHLLDADGKSVDLVRMRKNDKVTITMNGYNVRQKDMDVIFGDSEVFLSIFNPTFFIEYLGSGGQALLKKYLPVVEHETVLSQMSEPMRALLADQSLLSPETFIQQNREELRELQDGLIALDGQAALLMTQGKTGKQDLAILDQRRQSLSEQVAALRKKHDEGVNLDAMRQEYAELLLRIDEATADQKDAQRSPPILPAGAAQSQPAASERLPGRNPGKGI